MKFDKNKISKSLSFLLRHHIGKEFSFIDHDEYGFINIDIAINHVNKTLFYNIKKEELIDIIENDYKSRFFIKDNKIKANYGHSFHVESHIFFNDNIPDKLYSLVFKKNKKNIKDNGFFTSNRKKYYFYDDKQILLKEKNIEDKILMIIDTSKLDNEIINSFFKNSKNVFQTSKTINSDAISFEKIKLSKKNQP